MYCSISRQCTECDSSSSEEEDSKIDPNDNTSLLESRQKRNIKEPSKFTPGKDVSIYELNHTWNFIFAAERDYLLEHFVNNQFLLWNNLCGIRSSILIS